MSEFHPVSVVFPLMDGVELAALVEDIRVHGLLEPIVMYEGKILDGRNRLRACELADVKPRFIKWQSDELTPTEWVVSKNLHRRHLTVGQRAALALDLLPRLEEEAKERSGARTDLRPILDAGRSDEKAADLVGVGRSTVATAKAIQKRDESGEIVDAMRAGEATVSEASRRAGFEGLGQGPESRRGILEGGKRDSTGRVQAPVYYGKGDKFKEAIIPASRYFAAWRSRDFRFSHLNYKEARKRLRLLNELAADIDAACEDLSQRADPAKLRV